LINEHKQTPTQITLENAIIAGNSELYDYLSAAIAWNIHTINVRAFANSRDPEFQKKMIMSRFDLSLIWQQPHYGDVIAASGNYEIFIEALNFRVNWTIIQKQQTLDWAASSGNIDIIKYLLNLDDFDVIPDSTTLKYAIISKNPALVRFLLTPSKHYYCNNLEGVDIATSFSKADVIGNILTSHQFFISAVLKINGFMNDGQKSRQEHAQLFKDQAISVEDSVLSKFKFSYQHCAEHCIEMFKDVILHPTEYKVNERAKEFITAAFKTALHSLAQHLKEQSNPVMNRTVQEGLLWLEKNVPSQSSPMSPLESAPKIPKHAST